MPRRLDQQVVWFIELCERRTPTTFFCVLRTEHSVRGRGTKGDARVRRSKDGAQGTKSFVEVDTGKTNERVSVEICAEGPLMRVTLIVGLLFALLTAGCASVKPPPSVAPSPTASPQTAATTVAPVAPPVAPPSPPAPTATQRGAATGEPASALATPSTSASTGQRDTRAVPPAAKVPPPAPAAQATKKDSTPLEAAKQKPPPLDLASLETHLKETKAIGILTKIALKNQVDDLLSEFRAFYQGKLKTTLAELRRSYDLLVLKFLALLQDGDPPLASAIVASREAIWGILADPAKFATI
jgi:hypothetical protein